MSSANGRFLYATPAAALPAYSEFRVAVVYNTGYKSRRGSDFSRRPPFPPPRPIIQFFFSSYSRREKARQKPRGKNCSCQLLGGSRRKSKTLARRLLFGRVRMQQQQYPRFPMPPRSHKKPPRSSFRDINDFILEADGVYRPFGIFTGQS